MTALSEGVVDTYANAVASGDPSKYGVFFLLSRTNSAVRSIVIYLS